MERLFSKAAILAAILILPALDAGAEKPLEVVRACNARVLEILAENSEKFETVETEESFEDRLFAVIDPVTDYDILAGSVVDGFCPKLTSAQCKAFKETFTRLLKVSSIKKLGRYRADRFDYLGEDLAAEEAVVRTCAWYGDEEIPLDYTLRKRGERWLIVNYTVDGIDTARNYRKQFTRLLARGTFQEMIDRLQRKIAEHEDEN